MLLFTGALTACRVGGEETRDDWNDWVQRNFLETDKDHKGTLDIGKLNAFFKFVNKQTTPKDILEALKKMGLQKTTVTLNEFHILLSEVWPSRPHVRLESLWNDW